MQHYRQRVTTLRTQCDPQVCHRRVCSPPSFRPCLSKTHRETKLRLYYVDRGGGTMYTRSLGSSFYGHRAFTITNHRETNKVFEHESANVFSISILNTMSIQERGHETQHSMVGSCRPWPALPLGQRAVEHLSPGHQLTQGLSGTHRREQIQ